MVELVSITEPSNLLKDVGIKTAEDLIVYIARVSNPSNQKNIKTGPKLLKYLIEHKHWSPFEHVSVTFEIKTSRAIASQILRHRSFTFQEFSQRYSINTELEKLKWREQGKTNRQVGEQVRELTPEEQSMVDAAQRACLKTYEYLISNNIAKECARMILPLNTTTVIYMTGTLRSWIHYINLRIKKDTQMEHRNIAEEIYKILKNKFPNVFEALLLEK
jgi:thymidylate synthase (FAD)